MQSRNLGRYPRQDQGTDGHWHGDHYGVMSMLVNRDLVASPLADWALLMKPEYAGQVALTGDPLASSQAILAVMAAGMSTGDAPGEAAGKVDLDYFRGRNAAGNCVPVISKAGTLAAALMVFADQLTGTTQDWFRPFLC